MGFRYLGWVAAGLIACLAMGQSPTRGPRYDADQRLLFPRDFETWVFVGSSLGLTYADTPPSHEMFHDVYIEPGAYHHYRETGEFPEGTMLAMTLYAAESKTDFGSGLFSGELHGVEVAVKDRGWSYYDFGGLGGLSQVRATARAFPPRSCHRCHLEHARDDNVFVQYYPVLRRIKEGQSGRSHDE